MYTTAQLRQLLSCVQILIYSIEMAGIFTFTVSKEAVNVSSSALVVCRK